MTEVKELPALDREFLQPYLPTGTTLCADGSRSGGTPWASTQSGKDHSLPFVTLTYASSLDSMISLAPGLRTTLSGPETKSMTHFLRLHHDAILVGVGTAIPDDPSLNCRYPGVTLESQPRPVIIDPKGRWQVKDSKVAQLASDGHGKMPWVIKLLTEDAKSNTTPTGYESILLTGSTRATAPPKGESSAALDWPLTLKTLKQKGVNSVMIEGGATIISTLLSKPELVDSVILTIAPTWLGHGGVVVTPAAKEVAEGRIAAAKLHETSWRQFGADAVLCGRLLG